MASLLEYVATHSHWTDFLAPLKIRHQGHKENSSILTWHTKTSLANAKTHVLAFRLNVPTENNVVMQNTKCHMLQHFHVSCLVWNCLGRPDAPLPLVYFMQNPDLSPECRCSSLSWNCFVVCVILCLNSHVESIKLVQSLHCVFYCFWWGRKKTGGSRFIRTP